MSIQALTWVATAVTVAAGVAGLIRWVVRPLRRLFIRVMHWLDAWYGEPARDGLPARPGVVDRIVGIENEVVYNGGRRRLVDAVKDLETGQAEAKTAAETARDLAAEVHDEFHAWIEESAIREEAYRASLAELGIVVNDPPPRDPNTRTRHDDRDGDHT